VPYLALAARVLLGVVFLISVGSKLRGPAAFAASVAALRVVPAGWVRAVAVLVVTGEAATVVLLATPAALFGFATAVLLLVAFSVAIGATIRRGTRTTCRCFGTSAVPLGPLHLVRNAALVAVAAGGAVATVSGGAPAAGGLVVAAAAGLLAGGLVTVIDDIRQLFHPYPHVT
jgi:methylamine utilization protein MauE